MKKTFQFVTFTLAALGAVCLTGCASMSKSGSVSKGGTITEAPFGNMPDGTPVRIYTLRNKNGMEARITTYGGIVQSLKVPDKNGNLGDVVFGFDNLDGHISDNYLKNCP
jgi:aldose 1-epimerase